GKLPPRDEDERIDFFGVGPGSGRISPEIPINEAHGAVVGRGPAVREQTRVVESDDAFGDEKRRPVVPVMFDGFFAMITVDQKKIDRLLPSASSILAERFHPDSASLARGINSTMSSALQEIQNRH